MYTLLLLSSDPPDCGYGFMSVERIRLLLGLGNVSGLVHTDERQQITPAMRFTCNGMVTKWIVGANFNEKGDQYHKLYLMVWRNVENDTYREIDGTSIDLQIESDNRIYEYDNFSPIPFQAGDILGVFFPPAGVAIFRLLSENTASPTNYYVTVEGSAPPYDLINMQSATVGYYHPLVSAEIGKETCYTHTMLKYNIYFLSQLETQRYVSVRKKKNFQEILTNSISLASCYHNLLSFRICQCLLQHPLWVAPL